eukprot:4615318-Pyramimonas_sp.AAC.1
MSALRGPWEDWPPKLGSPWCWVRAGAPPILDCSRAAKLDGISDLSSVHQLLSSTPSNLGVPPPGGVVPSARQYCSTTAGANPAAGTDPAKASPGTDPESSVEPPTVMAGTDPASPGEYGRGAASGIYIPEFRNC